MPIPARAEPDRYHFASHARYLDAFHDEVVGTGQLTLVLHNWGGALGFDWAYRHQQRVRAIAYMETFVGRAIAGWLERTRRTFPGLV